MVIRAFAAAFLAMPLLALADPDDGRLMAYCNAGTGDFFIAARDPAPPGKGRYTSRKKVEWGALLKLGPDKNQWGDLLRTGSRVKVLRCGPLAVRVSSGFLNANPQGELGALDFPVVEVRMGKRTLLPPTALEQCELGMSRYRYFGDCPDRWAQDIEVRRTGGELEVRVRRVYLDEKYDKVEKVEVLR